MDLGAQESRKTIFLVCGMSGAGKDSLVKTACDELGLTQVKSYTTRPRRKGEKDTHIFIDEKDFDTCMTEGKGIVAFTKIGKYIYFATQQQLHDADFYVIDPNGIKTMKNIIGNYSDFHFVTIYINTPRNVREQRAINKRNDDVLTFYERCFNEEIQFQEMLSRGDFDYAVSNVNFDTAYSVFKAIIEAELEC